MQQMSPSQYPNVRPLFARLQYTLAIDSIIAGNTRGEIYVDQASQPQSAVIWNKQDTLLVAGSASSPTVRYDLGDLLCTQIFPAARRRAIPELALLYTPMVWETHLTELLIDMNFKKAYRRFYSAHKLKSNWRTRLLPRYTLVPIDQELLENDEINGIDSVRGWILSFWETLERFNTTGFGYCTISQQQIASWCLTIYASGRQYELGAATADEYCNKGLGTVVAAACVAHCDTHDYTPHWHCWERDRAAIAVAQKVGFDRPLGYSVFQILL